MTEYKDKICRHCIYGDKTEYEKPCVIYSDDCKFFKSKPKVLIQEYTNNGSMIADIFNIIDTKNVKTSINEEQNLVEVCGDGFTMWFDIDWWDAPYEGGKEKTLEQQSNRCDSCTHSAEQDGSNCYECVKGMADNFEGSEG